VGDALSKELIIDTKQKEIAIALLEEKRLVELNKEKSNLQFAVGDIYLGKVKKIMPGLNAAFVDVGYEKDAFLHYLDLGPQFQSLSNYLNLALNKKAKVPGLDRFKKSPDINKHGKIKDLLKGGQLILVQVAKEPISSKGPRLTSEISIAGRNLVLIPFSDKVSVSTKIHSEEERTRLKRLILSIKPRNYGVIVRTVAKDRKVALLDTELRSLVEKWESAFKSLQSLTVPSLVIGELNRTAAILRDLLNASFNSIYVNDASVFRDVKEFIGTIAPEKQKIVKHYSGRAEIFEHFGIEKQIKSLFGKTVSFKSGAYLIIEHTEALHVIDVNSGNRAQSINNQEQTALEVNLSAADEIARQLRLRDMGGIIVVDFIDLTIPSNRTKVFDRMKHNMDTDRAKHNILPLSKFGLMQITRQRVRPEMEIQIMETCPTCAGTGEVTPSILLIDQISNKYQYILEKFDKPKLILHVHPFVEAYINKGLFSIKRKWILKFKHHIDIKSDSHMGFLDFEFIDKTGDKVIV